MSQWIFNWLGVPPELSGQPWHLVFERPAPPWLCLVGFVVIFSTAIFSYVNMKGKLGARIFLAILRVVALFTIATLSMEPTLEWPQERIEPDFVDVLVDRSSSLQVRDMVDT